MDHCMNNRGAIPLLLLVVAFIAIAAVVMGVRGGR